MEMDLFQIFEPVFILAVVVFIGFVIYMFVRTYKFVSGKFRLAQLRSVMKKRLKNGEKVTINDEKNTYFSYRAIRIGNSVYMPVLQMKEGKIVVESILERKHTDSVYFASEFPGTEYQSLLLKAKEEKLKK